MQEWLGERLEIDWRSFSLEQANRANRTAEPGWRIWELADDYPSRGLWALRAGEAARNQGPAAHGGYHMALLRARHEQGLDIADRAVLREVANGQGLDLAQFDAELADRRLLDRIAADHTRAIEELEVFGTPTLVFGPGRVALLKMLRPPPPEEALAAFESIRTMVADLPTVLEVKRPQKKRYL